MDVSNEMLKDIVLIQRAMIDNLDREVCRLEDVLEYGTIHGEKSSEEFDVVVELVGKFDEKYNVSYFSVISTICKTT